jgi:hypothetical protein
MTDDQKSIALQQLANIVIDTYLNRDSRFVPRFREGTKGRMFLSRPVGEENHPDLQLGFMYRRSDYEPENR